MVAWFGFIVANTTSFVDAAAVAAVRNDLAHAVEFFTRLPPNVVDVGMIALFLISGAGAGDLLFAAFKIDAGGRIQRAAFALCLGVVVWTFSMLALGYAGYLIRPPLYALFAIGLLVTLWRFWRFRHSGSAAPKTWQPHRLAIVVSLLVAVILVLNAYIALLGAVEPEVQFDARYYHLAEALRYALHGRIFDLVAQTRVLQFGWPQYQEVVYAGVIVMFGLPAAKILSWFNLILAVIAIFAFCSTFIRSRFAGLLASAIFVGTPIVAWSSATAGNDLSLAPFTLLSIFAFFRWKAQPLSWRWAAVAGTLAGFAFGIKMFGILNIITLLVMITAECLRTRGDKRAVALSGVLPFLIASFVVALPSLIRSEIVTHDPVFPVLGAIFHAKYLTPSIERALANIYQAYGENNSLYAYPVTLWNVTVHVDQFRDIIGPLFLWAAPFVIICAIFERSRSLLKPMLYYGAVWMLLLYASKAVQVRFGEAILPLACIGIAYVAAPIGDGISVMCSRGVRIAFLAIVLIGTVLNTQPLVPFQRHALLGYVEGLEYLNFPYLYEGAPEREVQLKYVPMIEYINQHLNLRTDKVYDAADGIVFNSYSDIDLFNGAHYDSPAANGEWDLFGPNAYAELRRNNITHVMVFKAEERRLRTSPLFSHLVPIEQTSASLLYSGNPAYGEILYRVR